MELPTVLQLYVQPGDLPSGAPATSRVFAINQLHIVQVTWLSPTNAAVHLVDKHSFRVTDPASLGRLIAAGFGWFPGAFWNEGATRFVPISSAATDEGPD